MSVEERPGDEPVPGHDADLPDSDADDTDVDVEVSDHEGEEQVPGHDADVDVEPTDPLQDARHKMDRAEDADDDTRLEVLEEVRRALEAELDTSVENGSARH